MLGYACTYEGTDQSGDPGPRCCVGQDHAQCTRRDSRPDNRYHTRQDAETGEGAQAQPGHGTGEGTRSGVCLFFGDCVTIHAVCVSHGDADFFLPESDRMEFRDSSVRVQTIFKHADNRGSLLSLHGRPRKVGYLESLTARLKRQQILSRRIGRAPIKS